MKEEEVATTTDAAVLEVTMTAVAEATEVTLDMTTVAAR